MSNKKEAYAALDKAHKEYKKSCGDLKAAFKELDKVSDEALAIVSDVEILIESIRHRPWSYKTIKHKISIEKKQFIDSKDLKRKERNKNITAGAVAGGIAAGGITLIAFMKDICQKNIIRWIICLALFVFVFIGFLIYKLFNGVKSAQKAYEEVKTINEEMQKNRRLYDQALLNIHKIISDCKINKEKYEKLVGYANSNYKELPEEVKDELWVLYNLTLSMTEHIKAQLG